jgi:tetratricopeptide (TPR) repeat protein
MGQEAHSFFYGWEKMKKPSFFSNNFNFYKFLPPLTIFLSLNLYAQNPALVEYNQFFKSGQYSKAISSLLKLAPNETLDGQKNFLIALSFSKLQEYDKAITHFDLAIKEHNTNEDLYYEYGQALYAANELKAARNAFSESANKKFNVPASIYYVAHISQLLDDYIQAKDNYSLLIKNQETDPKIKQIARFQLAETLLLLMREKNMPKEELEKQVEKYILPLMKQALISDKTTPVAFEITNRIQELEKEFDLDPNTLKNGRRISPKRFSAYVSQKVKFDDNISNTNEENIVLPTHKESYIFETEAYAKYDFVLKKRIIITPEARINFSYNTDQDSPEVFQNDAYLLFVNLKNKFEHKVKNNPASFLLDLEYSSTNKDWNQTHKREAYSKNKNIGIGESFSYFSFGDTSLKIKRKSLTGESEAINSTTYTISADQSMVLRSHHLLIALLEVSLIDNFNNTSSSTNTYMTRFDYLIPEIMPKYTLGLALATTFTDTLEQKDTRGTELTLNPSIDLSKEVSDKMKISVNYDFTKNKSKLSDYSYQKNVFSTEFRYSF